MPKPSTITTWATDPGATADPGATRRATGFVAGKKLPAKWLNWILNQNGAWFTYLRDLHTEAEFLNKAYRWTGAHRWSLPDFWARFSTDGDIEYTNTAGDITRATRTKNINLMASQGSFGPASDGLYVQNGTIPLQVFEIDLPYNAILTGVGVRYECLTSGSITVTAQVRVHRGFPGDSAPDAIVLLDGASQTAEHEIVVGVVLGGAENDRRSTSGRRFTLTVTATPSPSVGVVHNITHAWCQFLDPGPRNY